MQYQVSRLIYHMLSHTWQNRYRFALYLINQLNFYITLHNTIHTHHTKPYPCAIRRVQALPNPPRTDTTRTPPFPVLHASLQRYVCLNSAPASICGVSKGQSRSVGRKARGEVVCWGQTLGSVVFPACKVGVEELEKIREGNGTIGSGFESSKSRHRESSSEMRRQSLHRHGHANSDKNQARIQLKYLLIHGVCKRAPNRYFLSSCIWWARTIVTWTPWMLSTILSVQEKKRGEALPLCPFHGVDLARIMDPLEIRGDVNTSLSNLQVQ